MKFEVPQDFSRFFDIFRDFTRPPRPSTVATSYTRKLVSGGIIKRIGRRYEGRNHDSDRIELKIS